MAYKKYIVKNGKTYGPYVYNSKRINGKVISEYQGINKKASRRELFFGGFLLVVLLLTFTLLLSFQFTGKSVLNFEEYTEDGIITGDINILLKPGELIPENSTLIIENNEKTYTYILSDILKESQQYEGNFYFEDTDIAGNGVGYGFKGKKEIIPIVFFQLRISPSSINETPTENKSIDTNESNNASEELIETNNESSESNEELTEINNELSNASEELVEINNESDNKNVEENATSVNSEETSTQSLITGNAISKFFGNIFTGKVIEETIIQGDVSKDKLFEYDLPKNSVASLVSGSVKTEERTIDDKNINLKTTDDKVEITTNYSIIEEGFGKEYLNDEEKYIKINLNKLNTNLTEGTIKIKLIYDNKTLLEFSDTIKQKENKTDKEIIPEINETYEQENLTLTQEEKFVLESLFSNNEIKISTYEYRDKIIAEFTIGDYSLSQSYEKNLSNSQIKELIEKDKILWLKDIVREYNKNPIKIIPKNNLNISTKI